MSLNKYTNIFLDRDGVINEVIFRKDTVSSPRFIDEFKFRKDFLSFAKNVDKTKKFFVVTNQPDVKRKLLRENHLKEMHKKLMDILDFEEIFVCMHDDDDNCKCRKPKPGMILDAISKYNLFHEECIMIGDSVKDLKAANAAGIDAFLLDTNYNKKVDYSYKIQSLISII
tara:strand:+ start:21951 stop:22460 length:510 start_codon:yes stop_codon:yes gene_type:complete